MTIILGSYYKPNGVILNSAKVFRSYLKTPFLVLLVIEICVLFFSLYLAAYIRSVFGESNDFLSVIDSLWIQAAAVSIITSISMLSTGLYQGQIREGVSGVFIRIAVSFIASGLLLALFFYVFPNLYLDRGLSGLALVQAFFIIATIRAIFLELVDTDLLKKRILVYGAGFTAKQIADKLRRKSDRRGFKILGYLALQDQGIIIHKDFLIDLDGMSLIEYSKKHDIDEIVAATSDTKSRLNVDDLVECKMNGITVIDVLTFFEHEAGQIRIDFIDPAWLVFSGGFKVSEFHLFAKRIFDLLVSSSFLLCVSPVLILTIIAIKIEEGLSAPIFYSQIRTGLNGQPFKVYKFRSMSTDAEAGGAVWATKSDNRVTKVGGFMRKTRIDEIPQIFNVFNGTMSFVGPRPERPEFIEELATNIPYYHERHLLKPGITGWAQLNYPYGASVEDSYQKQLYDLYYIKNNSLFLDVLILLQTVEIVLFGKGAR